MDQKLQAALDAVIQEGTFSLSASEAARRVFQAMPAEQRAYIRSIEAEVAAIGDIE